MIEDKFLTLLPNGCGHYLVQLFAGEEEVSSLLQLPRKSVIASLRPHGPIHDVG